jgi:hypothetical protein
MTTAKLNAAIVATLDDSGETIVGATIAFGAVSADGIRRFNGC